MIAGFIIGIQMSNHSVQNTAFAESSFKMGDYIQLGKYNDEPILWRYVADDDNGKLILSDEVLCEKPFDVFPDNHMIGSHARRSIECPGNNYWGDSNIRSWLNSTAGAGEVEWLCGNPPEPVHPQYSYADEKGFLSDGNFTEAERTVLKETSLKTLLDPLDADLATQGSVEAWGNSAFSVSFISFMTKPYADDNLHTFDENSYNEISAEYTTDKVFLPDIKQIWQVYNNFLQEEYHRAVDTESAGIGSDEAFQTVKFRYYWLRTPLGITYGNPRDFSGAGWRVLVVSPEGTITHNQSEYAFGIRPAFYLNEENAVILSGSGTEEDPYVLDGKENGDISVYCNEEKLWFDQPPIMENNRVLVPMRFIFEALGAAVDWNGETQTVTAVCGDTNISLQIDRQEMYVNGEMKWLDVPARLLNDRTLVPIRAVSEAMEAKVEWIQKDKTVVITTQ